MPTFIHAVTSTEQLAYSGETLAEPAAVQILDENRTPMNGINVNFQVLEGNATVQESEVLTDANGIAFAYLTFTEKGGNVILEASTPLLSERVEFVFHISSSRTSRLTIIAGNGQEGIYGTNVSQKLSVRVTDDFQNVAVDAPVKFSITEGNGIVTDEVVLTNDEGIAEVGLTLSTTGTINTVYATTTGDTASFTLYSLFPSALAAPAKTKEVVKLRWEKSLNEGFSHYTLLKADARFPTIFHPIATINNPADITFSDSDVSPGYDYLYKVAAHTIKGSSIPSETRAIEFGEYISLEGAAADIEIDEVRKKIYLSMPSMNSIHVIDQESREILDRIIVGSQPTGIDLSEDNAYLYVALFGSGDVAILNLETRGVELVDVETALNDVRAFDVLEAAPGRVFVTGNTQQYGITYVAVIKTDMNNTVERFIGEVIRFNPLLHADYGNQLYILNENELYKLDPYGIYPGNREPSFTFSSKRNHLCVSPDGTDIYFDLEVLRTENFAIKYQFPFGLPTISPDGTVVHYLSYHQTTSALKSYSTSNNALLNEIVMAPGNPRQMKVSADNSTFYILTSESGKNRILLVENPR